jgi:hypothetical protein
MCLLYHPKVLAKALDVGASANEVARALRQLTRLPRVEPACLEGFCRPARAARLSPAVSDLRVGQCSPVTPEDRA